MAAAAALAERGVSLIVADLPADALLKAADAVRARGGVLFNAGAIDDRLREEDCRANVFHTAPTRSMLADGLAQYLAWKQWRRWLLVARLAPGRQALRRCAAARGAPVRRPHRAGAGVRGYRRRAAHRLGRRAGAAADAGVHAGGARLRRAGRGRRKRRVRRLPALSHLGRAPGRRLGRAHPGKLGCGPRALGRLPDAEPVHGAVQAPHDRARHAGVVGGAHDRRGRLAHPLGGHQDPGRLPQGARFRPGGIQGPAADLAHWNLQLRQPILLADGRTIVSVSPQEGFLHQVSELDTLGVDKPETKCKLS